MVIRQPGSQFWRLIMRAEAVRGEVQRLLRQVPFRPFVLTLEKGEHVAVEHPENIAFDPGADGSEAGSPDFYVISGRLLCSAPSKR